MVVVKIILLVRFHIVPKPMVFIIIIDVVTGQVLITTNACSDYTRHRETERKLYENGINDYGCVNATTSEATN
jgi:hypothetical protein